MNYKAPFFSIIATLIIFAQFSCSNELDFNDLPLNQEANLPYQQTLGIESTDLTLTINSIEESRCPFNMDCVWAGIVTIYVTVESPSDSQEFSLCLSGDNSIECGNQVEIGNYSYQLITVNPYPNSLPPPSYEDYEATIIITEL